MTTATNTTTAGNKHNGQVPNPILGKSGYKILQTTYDPPVWIVPDYIPVGLTILAARPKTGKSYLALQISQAKAAGGIVLDKQVQQGRVLYLALEDNEIRLQERMRQQGWAQKAAKHTTFFTRDDFRQYIGPLHVDKGRAMLRLMIETEGYKLIVADTVSRAFIGLKDMNDPQQVTAALDPLQSLALENNVGLVFVDHLAKPKGTSPNPSDDIMNSTAKTATADTLLGMYRNFEDKTVRFCGEGKAILPFDITLKFDPVSGCWQSQGDTSLHINNQAENEIIDALINLGAASLSEVCKMIGKNKGNTSARLTNLANRGIVEKIKHPVSGQTIAYKYIGS